MKTVEIIRHVEIDFYFISVEIFKIEIFRSRFIFVEIFIEIVEKNRDCRDKSRPIETNRDICKKSRFCRDKSRFCRDKSRFCRDKSRFCREKSRLFTIFWIEIIRLFHYFSIEIEKYSRSTQKSQKSWFVSKNLDLD